MKILFVTSMHPSAEHPQRGILVDRLARALTRRGHAIIWFPLGHDGGPRRYWRARERVRDEVARVMPDIVHAHFGYSGLSVPRVRPPLVTSFYGDDLNGTWTAPGATSAKSKIGVVLSQLIALRSAACIVVSEALRRRLWFSATRRRAVVVRDAVDPELFQARERDAARAKLGLPLDDVLVLFPHDLTQATKRLPLAEAAVEELRSTQPRARLWVVNGQPPDEMPWYYAAADVMVITSALESGPSSAKESLACGLPVVSVPVGDVQLFEDAPHAMLRADADPIALAQALERALARGREPRRSRLPAALTLTHAAEQVEAVYNSVTRRFLQPPDGRA